MHTVQGRRQRIAHSVGDREGYSLPACVDRSGKRTATLAQERATRHRREAVQTDETRFWLSLAAASREGGGRRVCPKRRVCPTDGAWSIRDRVTEGHDRLQRLRQHQNVVFDDRSREALANVTIPPH